MNGSDSQKNRNLLAHTIKNIQWETEYPKLLVLHEPVGTWGPAMRLGSRSELIVLDLIPKK